MRGGTPRAAGWEASYAVPPESLAIFRMFFGVALLLLLLPRFQWIAGFPDTFYDPRPGLPAAFPGFPPSLYFVLVDAVLMTAAIFLVAGRRVTLASMAVTAALLAGDTYAYGFGKVDHDILLVVLPVFLAAAGWNGRPRDSGRAMALLAVVVALGMATGAWQKIESGWLTQPASAVLGHGVTFAVWEGESASWTLALRLLPPAAWKAMDYLTVAFEAAFVLAIARARAFRALCGVACFFHVAVAVLMRLLFVWNIPVYAAFLDWERLLARLRIAAPVARLQGWLAGRSEVALIAVSALWCALAFRWGSPVQLAVRLLGPQYRLVPGTIAICVAAVVVVAVMALRLQRLLPRARGPAGPRAPTGT